MINAGIEERIKFRNQGVERRMGHSGLTLSSKCNMLSLQEAFLCLDVLAFEIDTTDPEEWNIFTHSHEGWDGTNTRKFRSQNLHTLVMVGREIKRALCLDVSSARKRPT
jgi:hypothetical protein